MRALRSAKHVWKCFAGKRWSMQGDQLRHLALFSKTFIALNAACRQRHLITRANADFYTQEKSPA